MKQIRKPLLISSALLGSTMLLALVLSFALLGRRTDDSVQRGVTLTPQKRVRASDSRDVRLQRAVANDVHVWRARKDSAHLQEQRRAGEQGTSTRSWNGVAIQLSDEEQAVLQEHPIEELGQLTAQAQEAYRRSSEADREEANRRYLMLLNLGAKVVLYERPEPSPELLSAQQDYLSAVRAAEKSGKPLSESAQGKLKESFLANQIKQEQAGFKTSGDRP